MTLEQIERATGRELDWLIAQELFGWSNRHRFHEESIWYVTMPDGRHSCAFSNVPAYSTSGDAMLRVLERMRELNFCWSLDTVIRGRHGAKFCDLEADLDDGDGEEAFEDTLPLAVAKAALLALVARKEGA